MPWFAMNLLNVAHHVEASHQDCPFRNSMHDVGGNHVIQTSRSFCCGPLRMHWLGCVNCLTHKQSMLCVHAREASSKERSGRVVLLWCGLHGESSSISSATGAQKKGLAAMR